ncbi:peptide-methionine (S)-S-oxide reductase MsrA [Thiobacter aerophilum]|uniref:Peptide methionine sulfoxide reductase MsrA n=1 Tax=Thiobacter aerophilum TaxID=3121275 RepID=A0ABV0EJE1_9BURK
MAEQPAALSIATLGGGCFWCLEAVFEQVRGVAQVVSGYAGGMVDNPTYAQVCTGTTGHAEVVQVHFDAEVVPYRTLLEIFFTIHDPTTPNRQGNDRGPQYRSIILYHDAEQKRIAEEVMQAVTQAGLWPAPLVTELKPLEKFWRAEDDHQGYFRSHPWQPYCQFVVAPKVEKFRRRFSAWLKA